MGYPTSALLRVNVVSKSELQEEWPPVERLLFKGGTIHPRETDRRGWRGNRLEQMKRRGSKRERERAN